MERPAGSHNPGRREGNIMDKVVYKKAMEDCKRFIGKKLTSKAEGEIEALFSEHPISPKRYIFFIDEPRLARFEDFPHNGWSRDIKMRIETPGNDYKAGDISTFHVGTIFLEKINSETIGKIEEVVFYPVASNFMAE